MIATTAGFAAGLAINFLLHTHLTFKTEYAHGALFRYLIVVLANYGLTLVFVSTFHQWLDMAILGKVLSLPVIAIIGFILSKHWIYRNKEA